MAQKFKLHQNACIIGGGAIQVPARSLSMIISTILLILAFVLFLLAMLGVGSDPRFQLVPAGLACWVLASLVPLIH